MKDKRVYPNYILFIVIVSVLVFLFATVICLIIIGREIAILSINDIYNNIDYFVIVIGSLTLFSIFVLYQLHRSFINSNKLKHYISENQFGVALSFDVYKNMEYVDVVNKDGYVDVYLQQDEQHFLTFRIGLSQALILCKSMNECCSDYDVILDSKNERQITHK